MSLRVLIEQLCEATDTLDPKTMAPDTRETHLDRKTQIDAIKHRLELAKLPADEDPETSLAWAEGAFDIVYYCTHNDVVARAMAAAKKIQAKPGNEVAKYIISAAMEREKLNKTRAANIKKYGPPKK